MVRKLFLMTIEALKTLMIRIFMKNRLYNLYKSQFWPFSCHETYSQKSDLDHTLPGPRYDIYAQFGTY